MSASDYLSQQLFHASVHPFNKGDIIEPRTRPLGGNPVAYATTSLNAASLFAQQRAIDAGADSAHVYVVEPMADDIGPDPKLQSTVPEGHYSRSSVTSPSGFKVKFKVHEEPNPQRK
jgi:hypothetical protein